MRQRSDFINGLRLAAMRALPRFGTAAFHEDRDDRFIEARFITGIAAVRLVNSWAEKLEN